MGEQGSGRLPAGRPWDRSHQLRLGERTRWAPVSPRTALWGQSCGRKTAPRSSSSSWKEEEEAEDPEIRRLEKIETAPGGPFQAPGPTENDPGRKTGPGDGVESSGARVSKKSRHRISGEEEEEEGEGEGWERQASLLNPDRDPGRDTDPDISPDSL